MEDDFFFWSLLIVYVLNYFDLSLANNYFILFIVFQSLFDFS